MVGEITAAGGEAVPERSSVVTPEGGTAIVGAAIEVFGRIDGLVNNAGILRDEQMAELSLENLDAVLDVHLRGSINVTRAAFPRMLTQGSGRIVMTSSPSIFGNPTQSACVAAKMGIVGLTRVLALEGASHGVRVNAVAPGARTRMSEGLPPPLDRLGPETVAPVVAYLVSEACSVTGDTWLVAAGRIARVVVGLTPGWFKHPFAEGSITAEEVAGHTEEIRRSQPLEEPESLAELITDGIDRLSAVH